MQHAFRKYKMHVFNNKHLSITSRINLYSVLVLSAMLYGCSLWRFKQNEMNKLESLHFSHLKYIIPGMVSHLNKEGCCYYMKEWLGVRKVRSDCRNRKRGEISIFGGNMVINKIECNNTQNDFPCESNSDDNDIVSDK